MNINDINEMSDDMFIDVTPSGIAISGCNTKPDGDVNNPSALLPNVPALVYERVPSGFKI